MYTLFFDFTKTGSFGMSEELKLFGMFKRLSSNSAVISLDNFISKAVSTDNKYSFILYDTGSLSFKTVSCNDIKRIIMESGVDQFTNIIQSDNSYYITDVQPFQSVSMIAGKFDFQCWTRRLFFGTKSISMHIDNKHVYYKVNKHRINLLDCSDKNYEHMNFMYIETLVENPELTLLHYSFGKSLYKLVLILDNTNRVLGVCSDIGIPFIETDKNVARFATKRSMLLGNGWWSNLKVGEN